MKPSNLCNFKTVKEFNGVMTGDRQYSLRVSLMRQIKHELTNKKCQSLSENDTIEPQRSM